MGAEKKENPITSVHKKILLRVTMKKDDRMYPAVQKRIKKS
jgi:hypothetical protein